MTSLLAQLPAVHLLLADPAVAAARTRHGAGRARAAARQALAEARLGVAAGAPPPGPATLVARILTLLQAHERGAYPGVINATGVLIHTNLGRAPRLAPPLAGYLALELDLDTGERGERLAPVVARLTRYLACESATVVTNNAAALVLLLTARAAGRGVVVSRGELVEIGGSFRLPEIMAASGARLVEVGCTNRTRAADFAAALGPETAAILVVHRSNFTLQGFVSSPELGELVALGRERGVPVWVDQGSGCHRDMGVYGLRREPTVPQILAAGAEVVLFSGDKLLGGPQAGILAGSAAALAPLRQHPLRRALRPDKSVLVALAATLDAFLAERPEDVPLYRLLATAPPELQRRARRLAGRLRRQGVPAEALASRAVLGGGTTPDQTLPSWAVSIPGGQELASRLRRGAPPVVARVAEDRVWIDLRAVLPEEDRTLLTVLLAATQAPS